MTSASKVPAFIPEKAVLPEGEELSCVRPAIPPVLIVGLFAWVGCGIAYGCTAEVPNTALKVCLAVSILFCFGLCLGLFAYRKHRKRFKTMLLVLLGATMGAVMGFTGSYLYDAECAWTVDRQGDLLFRATEDTRITDYGSSVVAALVSVDGEVSSLGAKVLVSGEVGDIRYGQCFLVSGKLKAVSSASSYYRSNGIVARCSADPWEPVGESGILPWICALRNRVIDLIGSCKERNDEYSDDGTDVLEAIICGYRTDLFAGSIYDSFKNAGVGHLVAVSGAHLAVMFSLVCFVLKTVKARRKLSAVLQVGFLLAYLVFSAVPISALRAAVMVGLGIMSYFSERRASTLNALGFCIIAVLALSPHAALSASFMLSASSTLGIVLYCSLFATWMKGLFPFLPKSLRDGIGLTLSATVLSLPLSIALFSQCSLITLLSNLICAGLFTLVCTFGFAAAIIALTVPVIGMPTLRVAIALSGVLCTAVKMLAEIPFACIAADVSLAGAIALTFIVGFFIWIVWPRPSKRGVLALIGFCASLTLVLFVVSAPLDRIVMFDVGQGDAILLQSGGRSIVIDTGNEPALLKKALARSHITHLDAIVITHVDDDHSACLDVASDLCEVDTVYVAQGIATSDCSACVSFRKRCDDLGLTLRGLTVASSLSFGRFKLDVLWPNSLSDCGGNADSLVLLLTVDGSPSDCGFIGLFTGDAGETELERLFSNGFTENLDLLKVGHHGSQTAMTGATAALLDPEIALISVGADNRYGHPTEEILTILAGIDCAIYRTDVSGDISIIFGNRGVEVRTQR